jgi:FlaG/FlaF family flagellin (archaellin)
LIAVTVALAAVIATIVGRIGVPAKAPYAILGVTADNGIGENAKITIIHRGGDILVVDELKVRAENDDKVLVDVIMDWGGATLFSPGEERTGKFSGENKISEGTIIKIKVIHTPSGQLLLDTSVRVE